MKTTGGLTSGRGILEVWSFLLPACADVNEAMQELTSVKYMTSEQHKDASEARKGRDLKDTRTILTYLVDRNPFGTNATLHNISTGVTAADNVNVDIGRSVGEKILDSVVDTDAFQYSFKRKNQAITMKTSGVKIGDETVNIDPQLLFQRLTAVKDKYDFVAIHQHYLITLDYQGRQTNHNLPMLCGTLSVMCKLTFLRGFYNMSLMGVPCCSAYHGSVVQHMLPFATLCSVCQ
jgi:hypothetical protein